MRLADSVLWPNSITREVAEETAERLLEGSLIALRDPKGAMMAVIRPRMSGSLTVRSQAQAVYGTLDRQHPGVRQPFEH
jgi:sulfate adenylyltransferase